MYFTGSYYDGLRVGHPDEFDLNLVMDLSVPKNSFEFSNESQSDPGFIRVLLEDPSKSVPMSMPMYQFVDKFKRTLLEPAPKKNAGKFFLMPKKMREWLQSIFDKASPKFSQHFKKFGIAKVSNT